MNGVDVIGIVVMILIAAWTTGSGLLFAWLAPKVSAFFAATSDNQFLEFVKRIAADTVDELDQAIENGLATKTAARARAVSATAAAISSQRNPKQVKAMTGRSPTELAETMVEASVNRKRAVQRAVEAGSVDVGPR